jgi:hypothetical protein
MRGAVRSVTLMRNIRMSERAYNFSAHFRFGWAGRMHCVVLTIVNTVTQPVEI